MYDGEPFNAITHLLGASTTSAGTVVLVDLPAELGDPWKVVSISVYGATLVLLYSASTLCYSLRGRAKHILRELDHHSICLLIAGSYTPFCIVTLRGVWGWSRLGAIWRLAAFGSLQEPRPKNGGRFRSLVIYVLLGWAAMVTLVPLFRALGSVGLARVAAGGLFYAVGIIFYALDGRLKHAHGVWHLFVLAASVTRYFVILHYGL